jgi:hypothetical protein
MAQSTAATRFHSLTALALLGATAALTCSTTLFAQVGNPQIHMGVVGETAAFPANSDEIPDDLTGRAFDGLESGDWERRWSLASSQQLMPISWFVSEPGDMPSIDWRYGWGMINRLQHPISSGAFYPTAYGEIISPMCVAGATADATGLSTETTVHIAEGVASTRTVYTIISFDGKAVPPAAIPVSVKLKQSMTVGGRWISADTGLIDVAGGGWFTITGAGIAAPYNYEWGQLASIDDQPFTLPQQSPDVVWGTSDGLEGWETIDVVGSLPWSTSVTPSQGQEGSRETEFVIQPVLNSNNKVKPSSVTFTAEIHTAAMASVYAQQPGHPDFEPDFRRFGGVEVAAGGAFTCWQLPSGYVLAIVDDPTPITKLCVDVVGGGKVKVGKKLTLRAHDGWGFSSWTDGRTARLLRDWWLATTFGHRLVGNSRTLFYLDTNNNSAIDANDTLLGESNDTVSPQLTVKVKKSWGKKCKVLAVSENAIGERGPIAIKVIKVSK